jgi:Domain of unknown function (DUF6969)
MTTAFSRLPRETLEGMAEAGAQIFECYRLLAKHGENIVGEVLKGQGTFYEYDHCPAGDVYDPETHSQYYYHAHRKGEHGHFHTFLREQGMPSGLRPIEQTRAAFMEERDDKLSHLIAISMNRAGLPIALFTTNRWVTADNWYVADDVIAMLDTFRMDMAYPSLPANIWINNMFSLFRPQIEELIRMRDAKIAEWIETHPDQDVFEDRELGVTSVRKISVERQLGRIHKALARKAGTLGHGSAELEKPSAGKCTADHRPELPSKSEYALDGNTDPGCKSLLP